MPWIRYSCKFRRAYLFSFRLSACCFSIYSLTFCNIWASGPSVRNRWVTSLMALTSSVRRAGSVSNLNWREKPSEGIFRASLCTRTPYVPPFSSRILSVNSIWKSCDRALRQMIFSGLYTISPEYTMAVVALGVSSLRIKWLLYMPLRSGVRFLSYMAVAVVPGSEAIYCSTSGLSWAGETFPTKENV